jgi:hypothetical protein
MNRREFLKTTGTSVAFVALASCAHSGKENPAQQEDTRALLMERFETITKGFLRNARATSPDYTVCDFPNGTKLEGCCTPSGKTYTSVARMLPAIAEFVAANDRAEIGGVNLHDVLLSTLRTAFDPKHPHYWAEPTGTKPTQRTVESSLVAIALARMGSGFVSELSPQARANINRWLTSCTVVPERTNNHAWFTAVNQATRLNLGREFPEFKGDEQWMFDDLKAMDVLAANAADGWYSDDPKLTVYDYYNFWTFGNFPLFWSRIAGDLYPEWKDKLRKRGREFLLNAPYFFAADGGVPLFGRSLLYRWSVLSPLVLGYEQGIWPHSPGLLRRIMRKNFAWWWNMGAYDQQLGKLRETLSAQGTRDVSESYIDNGHPYWAMQAFTFFCLSKTDPLWTAPEEKLPVEKSDYVVRIRGPKMLLVGTKSSGQVRWLQALNTPRRDYYRDKYNKFCWSSGFPFNVIQRDKTASPWDQALVLRDPATGQCAWRVLPEKGELLDDEAGVRTVWSTAIHGLRVEVTSTIRLLGEFEHRTHELIFSPSIAAPPTPATQELEILEGSYALGLATGTRVQEQRGSNWMALTAAASTESLVSWNLSGYEKIEQVNKFPGQKDATANLVYPAFAVISFLRRMRIASRAALTLKTLHYASPKPLRLDSIRRKAKALATELTADEP